MDRIDYELTEDHELKTGTETDDDIKHQWQLHTEGEVKGFGTGTSWDSDKFWNNQDIAISLANNTVQQAINYKEARHNYE